MAIACYLSAESTYAAKTPTKLTALLRQKGGFMRNSKSLQDPLKSAPELSYKVSIDIEKLKCIPTILTGLSCIPQVYCGEEMKKEIIYAIECFADIQRVFIDNLSDKMMELDSLIEKLGKECSQDGGTNES